MKLQSPINPKLHHMYRFLVNIKYNILRELHLLRLSLIRGRKKGIVDENTDHIRVYFDNVILATIGPDTKSNIVIVEFKHKNTDKRISGLIKNQKQLFNNLFNRDMPVTSRWEYALYHCGTTSNAYSKINTAVYWCRTGHR